MNTSPLDRLNQLLSAKYEVLKELGRGGMAVVYQARNRRLKRIEALKVLPEVFTQDEEFVRRFLHEASTAAQLSSHPNIVTIYDVDQIEGVNYFTMEYLEGETLAKLLEREGALPVEEAVRIAGEVCSALAYAHAQGVIHRDIKPENIMVCKDNRVVVMDFGIARAAHGTRMTTRLGMTLGTPHYMSPEQVEGRQVDERSDLYSLGIVLYYMATGQVPFQAEDTTAILYQQVHKQPVEPRLVNRQVSPWLNSVILKALAKDPEARFQTARGFSEALEGEKEVVVEAEEEEEEEAAGKTVVFSPGERRPPVQSSSEGTGRGWFKPFMIVLVGALVVVFIWGRDGWQQQENRKAAQRWAEQQRIAAEEAEMAQRQRAEAARRAEEQRKQLARAEATRHLAEQQRVDAQKAEEQQRIEAEEAEEAQLQRAEKQTLLDESFKKKEFPSPPWTYVVGTPSISTAQYHSAPSAYHVNEDQDMLMYTFEGGGIVGEASAWIYDNASLPLKCMFAIRSPRVFASLGIHNGHSGKYYVTRSEIDGIGEVRPTDVPRSTGWHKFAIVTDGADARFYIDGEQVDMAPGVGMFTTIDFGDGWGGGKVETFVDDVKVNRR